MANTKTSQPRDQQEQEQERDRNQQLQRGYGGALQRGGSPFQLMRQISDDMDRMLEHLFDGFGLGRRSGLLESSRGGGQISWSPRIEAFQKDDKFVVRAELPGVKREDVNVSISDEAVTIEGQRKHEQREEREGFYHSEWSYGSFSRTIPLPEGAIVDNADASFRDGVLQITIPAPPTGVKQQRRIDIKER